MLAMDGEMTMEGEMLGVPQEKLKALVKAHNDQLCIGVNLTSGV